MMISTKCMTLLYLHRILLTQPMPRAATRKGTANPKEYEEPNKNPLRIEPPLAANVMIDPRIGPTQGAHPAEKKTPIKNDDKYPQRMFTCE